MPDKPLSTRFLRDNLNSLTPYHVEPIPHRIKLDANESPYDVPELIKGELRDALADLPLNRYPDSEAAVLKAALAEHLGVEPSHIAVGNGSDELIAALILALARDDARVISPEPTFSMYRILSQVAGVEFVGVPLGANFEIDPESLDAAIQPNGTNLVFFSYPNNPTGNCWDVGAIESLLVQDNVLVVMDEAYFEFSGLTFLPRLAEHKNLIVLRSFSKAFGLAGLRVGYMIADPEWVACVDKVRLPYNVNAFSQTAARILLRHAKTAEELVGQILAQRDRVAAAMAASEAFHPFPSDANFVFFRANKGAETIFRRLVDAGILIRNLNRPGAMANCLRVTAGTPDETTAFLNALRLEG
ncbi:MAG: histidinol-phosphate transaminase [Candidatus Poribacteria bacterium]|nr:histidinol-phosphate transaminase [Candidatus Poribacteria bacterium]